MLDESKDKGSENPRDLKEFEHQEMLGAATEINPRVPQEILNPDTAITSMEHALLRSSPPPGAVFHPNLPLACVAGASLVEINRVRQERNANPRVASRMMWLKVGDDFLMVYFKFLELAEEDLQDSEPRRTFAVVTITDMSGKEQAVAGINELIDQKIFELREKERRELEGCLQGKISTDSS